MFTGTLYHPLLQELLLQAMLIGLPTAFAPGGTNAMNSVTTRAAKVTLTANSLSTREGKPASRA
jgi:hypothetical protein